MRAVPGALLSLGIIGAGVGGFLLFGKAPKVAQIEDTTDDHVLVRTAPVTEYSEPLIIDMDGEANAWRVISVGAQVKGQISHKSPAARNGMFVEQGVLLFEIDPTSYELEVERLEAQLNQTDEETRSVEVDMLNSRDLIVLAESDWKLQDKQLKRIQAARKRGSTSESDVDATARQEITARSALQTLRNSLRSQQQMLKQKQATHKLVAAQLKQAKLDWDRCQVFAPLSGRIVDDIVEQGDFIKDGEPLIHISDSSQMEVKCSLRSDDLRWVLQHVRNSAVTAELTAIEEKPDRIVIDPLSMPPVPCEVAYDFEGTEFIWKGVLSRFEGTGMDRDTRTFPCRVTVPEPSLYCVSDSPVSRTVVAPPALLSGMFVTVRIPISVSAGLLRVPVEAVRPGGRLWVVRNNVLRVRQVSVARSQADQVLVEMEGTDLAHGDEVVISPLVSVRDGMPVRVEDRP